MPPEFVVFDIDFIVKAQSTVCTLAGNVESKTIIHFYSLSYCNNNQFHCIKIMRKPLKKMCTLKYYKEILLKLSTNNFFYYILGDWVSLQ